MLDVNFKDRGIVLQLDAFWLRDHCRCAKCYNTATNQRSYNLLEIPSDIRPLERRYTHNQTNLQVKWSDDHLSNYELSSLYEAQHAQVISRRAKSRTQLAWTRLSILKNELNLRFHLSDLVKPDELIVRALVGALVRYGIVLIDGVPPDTTMTEMAVRRVFPVMKTFFGEMYTFSDQPDHADTAYSKLYLGAHTDNTYFCDAAGLQALHCIAHVNGTGGENFFVDGLQVVSELRRQNAAAYNVLCTVPVPAEYIEDGQHHRHVAPIIRTDPFTQELIQLRLNVYDRAVFDTIPQGSMHDFYVAFREFLRIVQNAEHQWTFKLNPGTIVIFDNWRIFHGRHAYTGQRTMTGCYVQRTDYLSKARTLGIIE